MDWKDFIFDWQKQGYFYLYNNQKNKSDFIKEGGLFALVVAAGPLIQWLYTYYKTDKEFEKRILKEIELNIPKDTDLVLKNDEISFELIDHVDKNKLEKIEISDKTKEEYQRIFSDVMGNAVQLGLCVQSFHGLLKCDIPIACLANVNGNSELLRGYALGANGKIIQQAKFSPAGAAAMGPLIVFQCMAFVTSQYYQHQIFKKLEKIEKSLNLIINWELNEAKGIILWNVKDLYRISLKKKPNGADLENIFQMIKTFGIVATKFGDPLNQLVENGFATEFKWFDFSKVEEKASLLQEHRYHESVRLMIAANKGIIIAAYVGLKLAMELNDEDGILYFCSFLNTDLINQIRQKHFVTKHFILKYLEAEKLKAIIKKSSINKIFEHIQKEFEIDEQEVFDLSSLMERKTENFIEIDSTGSLNVWKMKQEG